MKYCRKKFPEEEDIFFFKKNEILSKMLYRSALSLLRIKSMRSVHVYNFSNFLILKYLQKRHKKVIFLLDKKQGLAIELLEIFGGEDNLEEKKFYLERTILNRI